MNEWKPNCKVLKVTSKGKHVYVQIPDVLGEQYGCPLLPASEPLPTPQDEQKERNVEEGESQEKEDQEEDEDEGDEQSEDIEADKVEERRRKGKRRRGPEGSESLVGPRGVLFIYPPACLCRTELIACFFDKPEEGEDDEGLDESFDKKGEEELVKKKRRR